MLSRIASLTTVRVPSGIVQTAGGGAVQGNTSVPIFIHPRALTYPIMVALVKGGWSAMALLPLRSTSSIWFPFIASLLLGILVAISNLTDQRAKLLEWIVGLVIGLLNSLVIFGAVVSIPVGKT